jgi:hypothetical protein
MNDHLCLSLGLSLCMRLSLCNLVVLNLQLGLHSGLVLELCLRLGLQVLLDHELLLLRLGLQLLRDDHLRLG